MSESTSEIDRKLVIRLSKDDKDAFCELYLKYRESIIFYAVKFLKSEEIAEDISQDTFAAIWKTRQFLNPNKSFSSYLFTIAHNRILNLLRNISSEQKLYECISSQAIDYYDSVLDELTSNEMKEIILNSINKLPDVQREAFVMSREENLSHSQIAVALGISERNVNACISSALKSIRQNLEKHYGKSSVFLITFLFL